MNLGQTILDVIDSYMYRMHTALPGVVQAYDRTKCTVDVQPTLKWAFQDQLIEMPVIQSVPVVFPRTTKSIISLPIAAGDTVLLIFAERSIDEWMHLGGIVDTKDARKFDLSDAIAIPGLFPFTAAPLADGDPASLMVQNDQGYLEVKPGGTFKVFSKSANDELFKILSDLVDTLTAAIPVCAGIPGDFDPGTVTNLAAIKTRLGKMKG